MLPILLGSEGNKVAPVLFACPSEEAVIAECAATCAVSRLIFIEG